MLMNEDTLCYVQCNLFHEIHTHTTKHYNKTTYNITYCIISNTCKLLQYNNV